MRPQSSLSQALLLPPPLNFSGSRPSAMGRPSDGKRALTPDLIIHINHAFEGSMDPLWDWQLTQQLGNQGEAARGERRIGVLAKKCT